MELTNEVTNLPFVGPAYERRLEKLGILTIEDLLLHIPNRYEDFRNTQKIRDVRVGETVTIKGTVASMKNIYTKSRKVMQEAVVNDGTGSLSVVWFNQPYLVKSIYEEDILALSGKVGFWGRRVALTSPMYEKLGEGRLVHTGRLVPIYPQTAGISSKWLRRQIKNANEKVKIPDFLPKELLKKENFISYKSAIKKAHFPKTMKEASEARRRLAFNELLDFQIKSVQRKKEWQENTPSATLEVKTSKINSFIKGLPFKLTGAQKKVVGEILSDFSKSYPMNRLLEGDVGSGKTVVGAIGAFSCFLNERKTLFMVPTQILAEQHFKTLKELFKGKKVGLALLTSGVKKGNLKSADIIIGTHSLIHSKMDLKDVGLVVIDEQQRFGVEQRRHLVKKTKGVRVAPHVLTMTATPIPRTIALTAYGDLALSTLDELPKGRKRIVTWLVPNRKREAGYKWMEKDIKKRKVQAFVVCPLIEESDKESMEQVKAAKGVFEELKTLLPSLRIGLLHGKVKAQEKTKIINSFESKKLDILVSTPIVEVGVDIANAAFMVIEGAERFGLAQLHQLRGRVGRGRKKSYCLLFTKSKGEKVEARLSAMQRGLSGFELSELDLKLRGPGEFFGTAQSGFPELKIASWADFGLIKKARKIAENMFDNPENFKKLLRKYEV